MKHIKLFEQFVNESKLPSVMDFYKKEYGNRMIFLIDGYEIIYDDKMKPIQVPYYPGDNKLSDADSRKSAKRKIPAYISGFKKIVSAGISYFYPLGNDWSNYVSSLVNKLGYENLIEFGENKNINVDVTEGKVKGYIFVIATDGENEVYSEQIRIK